MNAVARRVIVLLAMALAIAIGATTPANAQPALQVQLFEDPFLCDTVVRPLGTVSGLIPGEVVEFSSPQLNGLFSRRTADAAGTVAMRWNCDAPKTWSISVRGLTSGGSANFTLTGREAPAPPDAPVGAAFDNKTAMTTAQMAVWKDFSPFSTAGIYIPVNAAFDNRADKIQSNLTPNWVNTVFADGWSLIPIYVGLQAPDECATGRFEGLSTDPATARNQGLAAATDAVNSVTSLGIGPGNPIYYDMEAYRAGCSEAIMSFLDAWTEGVKAAGYVSGVYGSRSSTMADLSRAFGRPGFDAPDAVWVSTGNGRPTNFGLEVPADGLWANARMHQYRLNITRTYGGVTVEIDENVVNAPLARPGNAAAPTPSAPAPTTGPSTVDSDGDGFAEPEPDNCDRIANPDQADLDNDGDGDVCDRDIDGDGVDNVSDFAPRDPTITTAQAPTAVPEPTVAATPDIVDTDGDGFAEPEPDNCDRIANPDQADLDNDGDGDVCDDDIDGDGVANEPDQDPRDASVGALPTAEAVATVEPTAVPAEEPTAEPTAETTAVPTAVPTVEPTSEPTVAPAVILLPTPTSPTEPTPAPTVEPTPIPSVEQALTAADLAPDESIELATETVTITIQNDWPFPAWALAALASFSLFCAGMGVRSFQRSRAPSATTLKP